MQDGISLLYYQHNQTTFSRPMDNIALRIIVLVVILILFHYREQIKYIIVKCTKSCMGTKDDIESTIPSLHTLESAFKKLNIAYDKETEHDGITTYQFKYQAGVFLLKCSKSASSMQLSFPYIGEAKFDHLDLVRTACNDVNGVNPMASAVYKVDTKDDNYKIDIHIIAGVPKLSNRHEMVHTLHYALSDCFNLRNMLCNHLGDLIKGAHEEQVSDLEYEFISNERMKQIMASTEAIACDAKSPNVPTVADCTTLGKWLAYCDIVPQGAQIQQIVCEGDDGYHFTSNDADTIMNYRLTEPIVHQLGADNAPTAETASVKIVFTNGGEADNNKHTIVVALEKAATVDKDKVTYIRISYVTSNRSATSTATRIPAEVAISPKAGSMTIGVDWTTGKNKQTEFDYMWADARDKEREGHRDEWTAEQRLIHDLTDPTLAYNMYWGYKLMLQKRFYEAAQHFEYAWKQHNEHVKRYDEKSYPKWQKFYDTCLMLGTCYLNTGQYYKAFYYLHNLEGSSNPQYLRTSITCLMAAKDYRAKQFIENCMTQIEGRIKELTQTEQEVPPYLLDLYSFMSRKSVIFNIENAHYDEAEKTCKQMLKNDSEKDFALDNLAKIQSLRDDKSLTNESLSPPSE